MLLATVPARAPLAQLQIAYHHPTMVTTAAARRLAQLARHLPRPAGPGPSASLATPSDPTCSESQALRPAGVGGSSGDDAALFEVPPFTSSWDDLLEGVATLEEWGARREDLRERYLRLLRDEHAPPRPPPELQGEEEVVVDGIYKRQLVSYNVEEGERAHAYLGLPLDPFLAKREPHPAEAAPPHSCHPGSTRLSG